MDSRFVVHRRASEQLRKLPRELDERVRSKLREMVTNEFRDLLDYDVERVSGVEREIYRARIGDYRVFFLVEEPTVAILHVAERDRAYGNPAVLDDRATDFG